MNSWCEISRNFVSRNFVSTLGESYKYWVRTAGSLVLSVADAQFCYGTVVLTSSSTSLSTSHLFNIPRKRVSWLFLGWHSACLSKSLGCLEWLSNSQLNVFGQHSHCPASLPHYHENLVTWADYSLVVPLELPLASAHTGQPTRLTIMRTIWSEWTQSW